MSRPKDEKVVERAMKAHVNQIDRQAEFVLMAFRAMGDELPALTGGPMEEYGAAAKRFWMNAQSLLTASAIISKTLWPIRQNHYWRGRELRKMLGVPNDSPLKQRNVRDGWDHIDERFDIWAETPGPVIYMDSIIGDQESIDSFVRGLGVGSVPPEKMLRRYDAMTHTIYFTGDELHVPTLIHAIEDIRSTITGQPPTRIVSTGFYSGGKRVADGTDTAPDPEETT